MTPMSHLFLFLLSAITLSRPGAATERNVIFITFDGVRPEEFFHGTDPDIHDGEPEQLFPYFWSAMAPQGVVFGNREQGDAMVVGNPTLVSLPAYQSIMVGRAQPCLNNDCGRVRRETFPERLSRECV